MSDNPTHSSALNQDDPHHLIKYAETPPLPVWLSAPPPHLPAKPAPNRYLLAELNHEIYLNMFEHVLDKLSEGRSIGAILRSCNRGDETAQFVRWMLKDPNRKARYHEALEYGTEVVKAELIDISDGLNNMGEETMEDVQRSKLRIDTRLKVMGFDNKKRFGETKTIEINQNISITDALSAAKARMANIIDAEVSAPLLENDED